MVQDLKDKRIVQGFRYSRALLWESVHYSFQMFNASGAPIMFGNLRIENTK